MEISNIINLIASIFILILALGFIFYKKLASISILFIKILFPITIVVAFSTLFLPQIYSSLVENSFSTTVLASNLKSVDKTLTDVTKVQINIQNSINSFFNTGNQKIEEYQSNIYAEVTSLMVGMLRVTLLLICILVLVFILYIRYTFSSIFETNNLQKQINSLKKEIEELKSAKIS